MNNTNTPKKDTKQEKYNRKIGIYYSFLTVVLLFCLIQIGWGAILNITKIISYHGKSITLENHLKQVKMRNQDLKSERKMVTSDNSLEGIARNNLKMAGQDEVLVIINKKVEQPKPKKHFWKLKNFKWKKQDKEDTPPIEKPFVPEKVDEE